MTSEQFIWDAHTHSSCSDALDYTPTQVVERAAEVGAKVIALTDHDTTSGVEEAVEVGKRLGVLVVPGIEVTSAYVDDVTGKEGLELHVLGYGINDLQKLDASLEKTREARKTRFDRILSIYKELNGLATEIQSRSRDSATLTRGSISQSISDEDLRRRFMQDTSWGHEAYVSYPEGIIMPTTEALDMLNEYCKLTVLAHPGRVIDAYLLRLKDKYLQPLAEDAGITYSRDRLHEVEKELEERARTDKGIPERLGCMRRSISRRLAFSYGETLDTFGNHGLGGLEAYYSDHDSDTVKRIGKHAAKLSKKFDRPILLTLGSDFGHSRKELGTGKDNNLLQYQHRKDCEAFLKAVGLQLGC